MPEEDKQWDQVASFPPPRPPPATGPLFNDWLDGDDHAHSLGHTAPQFGLPVATSTPRIFHAGNPLMRIQDLLNSVPRYPAAVASTRSENSDGMFSDVERSNWSGFLASGMDVL
ncbi:hypothetical protein F5879DRAFT_991583 [Lentinula edodes]|nr:hypothetical protein F5879DRAFT_991583 [Lentinula edodes]